ncbi:MAG TPA: FAD/NAD(P)-binding oxidoreductase [Terracidiphilus sp.]|jgi:NADPH-dependent 2,4-dienoyl-CoA reductase/sulfur reductase-like enzyme
MSESFDVVVVGAGPGGIAAATVAAEEGQRTCLLDDNRSPGGQVWRGFRADTAKTYLHGEAFLQWTERLRLTNCEVWSGWQATDCPAPKILRVEREAEFRDIAFRKLVVATGARERFLPFPGWTLPGVTGAGGLQALVKAGLDARGKRVVVAGSGPLLLAIAASLADAGAKILAIYEQAPLSRLIGFGFTLAGHPSKLVEGARYRRKLGLVPYRTGCWVSQAEGSDRVERVMVTSGRKQWTHECDGLAYGFHLVPNLELPRLLGCRLVNGYVSVDPVGQSSVQGIQCIGELTGIGGLEKALVEGQIAGFAAAGRESEARALLPRLKRMHAFARELDRAFALRDELRGLPKPDTFVCRCEDVPYAELKECGSWREAKLQTRCGMGACQGRICGAATEFLFGWKYAGMRPPVFPTAVSAVAAKVDSPESVHL